MNLGRELVACALREKTLRPFLDAGLTEDWFSDADDTTWLLIFTDQDKEAYRLLLRYWGQFRRVPSLDYFQASYPASAYPIPASDFRSDEIVSFFNEDREKYLAQIKTAELNDLVEAGQYEEARKVAEVLAKKIRYDRITRDVHVVWDSEEYDVEARINRTTISGVGTGIHELDEQFPGFTNGSLVTYLGRAKAGKALALNTPLPTPEGWTTMGKVKEGDTLMGSDGGPCRVVAVTPVQYDRECFEVRFRSGEVLIADADHQWVTERQERSAGVRTYGVRTTREIAATLTMRDRTRHRVPVTKPLVLPEANLPIDPYILGYWLGDGTSSNSCVTAGDDDAVHLRHQIAVAGYFVLRDTPNHPSGRTINISMSSHRWGRRPLLTALREATVLNNKHVPGVYLRASYEQRLALLQGLMDSDGYMSDRYAAEFCTTDMRLAEDVRELIHSLGIRVRMTSSNACLNGVVHGLRYRLHFVPGETSVFRLRRKASRGASRVRGAKYGYRYISSVSSVPSVPVKCIQVDSADGTYLAGREMIPTHNTSFLLLSALAAMESRRVLFVSFEIAAGHDPDTPGITDRLDAFGAGVSFSAYARGMLTDPEKDRLREYRSALAADSLVVVQPTGRYTVTDLEYDLDHHESEAIYLDGFYFMIDRTTGKPGGSWEGHDNLARELKELALRKNIPVVVSTQVREKQLTRSKGKGIDDGAMMGGTGLVMASDMVLGFDAGDDRKHRVTCTRSRTGYLDPVVGSWDWETCRFNVEDDPDTVDHTKFKTGGQD